MTEEAAVGPNDIGEAPEPAGFGRRLLAKLVDSLVVFGASMVMTLLLALAATVLRLGAATAALLAVGSLLITVGYFAHLNAANRQTVGYRMAGVRLITVADAPVPERRSWYRAVLNLSFHTMAVLSLLALGAALKGWDPTHPEDALIPLALCGSGFGLGCLDYLCIFFSPRRQAVHDLVTRTRVIRCARPRVVPLLLLAVAALFVPQVLVLHGGVGLQAFYIPSGAMEDTLLVNDRLLVDTLQPHLRAPRFGEVMVFRAPAVALGGDEGDVDFIKRCMGLPSDIVEMKQGKFYRNGVQVREPYVKWSPYGPLVHASYDMKVVDGVVYSREYEAPQLPGPWERNNELLSPDEESRVRRAAPGKVPPGQYLMLGDHRNNSNDSHVWGFVPRASFIGSALCIFWPPLRAGARYL